MLYPFMAEADDAATTGAAAAAAAATATAEAEASAAAAAAAAATAAGDGRPEEISEAEWAQLSPAERVAIATPDEPEMDAEALAAIAGTDEAATAAAAAAAAAKPAPTAEEAAAAAAAAKTEDVPDRAPFAPVFKSDLPADFEDQVKANKAALTDLSAKFKKGDVDVDEYNAERETLDDKRRELDTLQIKADISRSSAQQTAEQRWDFEQDTFFDDERNAIYKGNKILNGALDAAVKDLSSPDALKAHPERAKWSGLRFLKEGDKQVRESLPGTAAPVAKPDPAAAATAAATAAAAAAKGAPRNVAPVDKGAIPPNLASLPAAQANEVGKGEFAYLEGLEGAAYERALAVINADPDKRERFVTSA